MARPGARRLVLMVMAALGVALAGWLITTLPPATTIIDIERPPTTVFGAYHIHTDRSDGSGTVDDVARAAARAGLQFVILTDHGDGTAVPDAPAYRHGVLVIDAVEVSSADGHIVVLGLPGAMPYPLGGEGRDIIEDAHRLGAWTVAAHPDSPKPDLRWRGPATDGLEWINADSEWRDESKSRVIAAAVHGLFRTPSAIAALFDRPESTMRRWDQWARTHKTVGMAAVDAHARIGIDEREEPRTNRTLLARPSYLDMFRTLVQGVWLPAPLSGDGEADARAVLAALRSGETYSVTSAIASPAVLSVTRSDDHLEATLPGAPHVRLIVSSGARVLGDGQGSVRVPLSVPGLYRLEAYWPGWAIPWIVSAPVFVHRADNPSPAARTSSPTRITLTDDEAWTVEQHPSSESRWTTEGRGISFTYTLGGGRPAGQYAALVHPLPTDVSVDEIAFDIRADRPMRVSLQVRLPDSAGGERWMRSIYADETSRHVRVRLEDFSPADGPKGRRPIAASLQSVLFVAGWPHSQPGSRGQFHVSGVTLRGPDFTSVQ